MSEELAIYNRDLNAGKSVLASSFVPEYGSSVNFTYEDPYFNGGDNSAIKYAIGINGTKLDLNLKFSNKSEEEANSFLHLFEDVSQKESGNLDFNTQTTSGVEIAFPTGNIYKNLKDFLIKDYDFKFHNNLFDVELNLQKNSHASIFDWSGSSYLNTGNIRTGWIDGGTYEKFDVVSFPNYDVSSNPFSNGQVNRAESFYYCVSGHNSTINNSPTGITGSSVWSQSLFYDIDDDVSVSSNRSNLISDSKNSFLIYNKTNSNEGLIKDLTLNLKNRSNKETIAILHFIEKHENASPFELSIPQLYKKRKFFVAKSMQHTFVYKDCNDIQIKIDEILRYQKNTLLNNFYHDN